MTDAIYVDVSDCFDKANKTWSRPLLRNKIWGIDGFRQRVMAAMRPVVPREIMAEDTPLFIQTKSLDVTQFGGNDRSATEDLINYLLSRKPEKGSLAVPDVSDDDIEDEDDEKEKQKRVRCLIFHVYFAGGATSEAQAKNAFDHGTQASQNTTFSPILKLSAFRKIKKAKKKSRKGENLHVFEINATALNRKSDITSKLKECYQNEEHWLYKRCNMGHVDVIANIISQNTNYQKFMTDMNDDDVRLEISSLSWESAHLTTRCGGRAPGKHPVDEQFDHPVYNETEVPKYFPSTRNTNNETELLTVGNMRDLELFKADLQERMHNDRQMLLSNLDRAFDIICKHFFIRTVTRHPTNGFEQVTYDHPVDGVVYPSSHFIPFEYVDQFKNTFQSSWAMKTIRSMLKNLRENNKYPASPQWVQFLLFSQSPQSHKEEALNTNELVHQFPLYIQKLEKVSENNETWHSNLMQTEPEHPGCHPMIQLLHNWVTRYTEESATFNDRVPENPEDSD